MCMCIGENRYIHTILNTQTRFVLREREVKNKPPTRGHAAWSPASVDPIYFIRMVGYTRSGVGKFGEILSNIAVCRRGFAGGRAAN